MKRCDIFVLIYIILTSQTALAIPNSQVIVMKTRTGIISIEEKYSHSDEGSLGILTNSNIYFITKKERKLISRCSENDKGSSQENIKASDLIYAVKSLCESELVTNNGGKTWHIWNYKHSIYTKGGIEDVKIKNATVYIKYSNLADLTYDNWLSRDGGNTWKKYSTQKSP